MINFSSNFIERLNQFSRIYVGLSGGLDSTVLLHSLAQVSSLSEKLQAVHVHHGLSQNADAWLSHCEQLCSKWAVSLITQHVKLKGFSNLEERARILRYQVFETLLNENDCVVLGHHKNDQAETLLLQLARGAGVDGLAAMPREKPFAKGQLFRPLLEYKRETLEAYAKTQGLKWVEDDSNKNLNFSRNWVRQQILPLLGEKWPKVVDNLAKTASLCQEAKENLDALAELDCPQLKQNKACLPLASLISLSAARQKNLLRFWLKKNHLKMPSAAFCQRMIEQVIQAKEDASPELACQAFSIRRYQQSLYLSFPLTKIEEKMYEWLQFPQPLIIEGLGHLEVTNTATGFFCPPDSRLSVRFRQGGERLRWHGKTRELKKLFQEWQIPPWLRDRIPLIFIDEQLAVIVGYAIADYFYTENLTERPCQIRLDSKLSLAQALIIG